MRDNLSVPIDPSLSIGRPSLINPHAPPVAPRVGDAVRPATDGIGPSRPLSGAPTRAALAALVGETSAASAPSNLGTRRAMQRAVLGVTLAIGLAGGAAPAVAAPLSQIGHTQVLPDGSGPTSAPQAAALSDRV